MKPIVFELFTNLTMNGPATMERQLHWPGGRGIFYTHTTGSGSSAKLKVDSVYRTPDVKSGSSGWQLPTPCLKLGGPNEFSTDSQCEVDLPECVIQFQIDLDEGDSISCAAVIVPMPEEG